MEIWVNVWEEAHRDLLSPAGGLLVRTCVRKRAEGGGLLASVQVLPPGREEEALTVSFPEVYACWDDVLALHGGHVRQVLQQGAA